jgi:hypothetical protein
MAFQLRVHRRRVRRRAQQILVKLVDGLLRSLAALPDTEENGRHAADILVVQANEVVRPGTTVDLPARIRL